MRSMTPAACLRIGLLSFCLFNRVAIGAIGADGEPPEIPLWPKGAPGSAGKTGPELVVRNSSGERNVSSVHYPSLTPFLPASEKAIGTGILVIPGGGHRVLCVDHEGYNVARWLQERGIAAFVLKHRLARETNSTYQIAVESLADTQRALRLIRSRATEWRVNLTQIGAIGFSAGGELVNLASARADRGNAEASDPIERLSARPDFQGLIYPGRSGDILPTKDSPPAFLACGFKDRDDIAEGLANVYLRFKRVGVPAELHIFAGAGHGFGVRSSNTSPAGAWTSRFEEWLGDQGFLRKSDAHP